MTNNIDVDKIRPIIKIQKPSSTARILEKTISNRDTLIKNKIRLT